METLTSQFNQSLKSSDLRSARKILAEIAEIDNEPYHVWIEVIDTLALVPDETAWDLLFFLSEISFVTPDLGEKLHQLILDRAHLNFHFLPVLYKTDNKKKIRESVPLMKHVLTNETDTGILVETIRAVGEYRLSDLTDEIGEYIYFDNDELKAHAVHSLQSIGSPRAISLLEHAAATVKSDHNILDALFILRQQNPIEILHTKPSALEEETTLFRELESLDLNTRFNAVSRLRGFNGKYKDRLAQNLLSADHDLVINTLDIVRHTSQEELIPYLYGLLGDEEIASTIKFATYGALGGFPDLDFSSCPLTCIDDPKLYVQMAVINLINKNPTDEALNAIRQRIEDGGKKGKKLVQAILYAKAPRIFESLMESDTFSYFASNYLEKQASLSCIEGYINILKARGLKTTTKKFARILEKKAAEKRPTALILGRSETMMAFHAALVHGKGYTPFSFSSSQDAFESAVEVKPELIVSELFLDGITVVEFAEELSEFYSSKELSFVISTLQHAFTGNRARPEWKKIGIHEVFAFPPDAAHIISAG